MVRVLAMLLLAVSGTGCLHLHGGGYAHSHNAVKGPCLEILYSDGEPAVMLLFDGNCGLEVKQRGHTMTGMFTVGDDQAVIWYFEPERQNPKQGAIWLGQGKAQLPKDIGWKSRDAFEIQKGNTLLLRWDGSDYTVRQTTIDDKKLKAIAKEHRTGFAAQDVTLESEKTWKIAAGVPAMSEFLQESRNAPTADGTTARPDILRESPIVQDRLKRCGDRSRRDDDFYSLAASINDVRKWFAVSQCEVVAHLGEPDDVTEYTVLDKPGEAAYPRLVYTYRLRRGNMKGYVVAVEFEKGLFTKYHYYPDAATK